MKTLSRLTRALGFAVALAAAAPMLADAQANELGEALKADKSARAYFESNKAPEFDKVQCLSADLNGDKIVDEIYVGYLGKQAAIALGTRDKDGVLSYKGFSPVDSKMQPSVKTKDFSGNGKAEVHIISKRGDDKMVSLVALKDGKATRIFREFLVSYRRSALSHYKVTKLINFVDQDRDGIREITVSERVTQLIGKGEKEKEISGSSVNGLALYGIKDGRYSLTAHTRGKLSPEAELTVAVALMDGGDNLRARISIGRLLDTKALDDQTMLAGTAMLSKIDASEKKLAKANSKGVKA